MTQNQLVSAVLELEEEVQLLLAEIATSNAIRTAEVSSARAVARREALKEALAVCGAVDDGGGAIRQAIAACEALIEFRA